MKQAFVIATVGRRGLVETLLEHLSGLSPLPDEVVLSAPTEGDLPEPGGPYPFVVTRVLGVRGASAQRNAGVAGLTSDAEIVAFIDDDSVPREDFLRATAHHFARHADSVAVTGRVVLEGQEGQPPLSEEQISAALADSLSHDARNSPGPAIPHDQLYGCNMIFRRAYFERFLFDERLPLYSWLEDTDLARRLLNAGLHVYKDESIVIVHRRDSSGGRTAHLRFGYSSVANWEYLRRKGSVTWADAPGVAKMMAKNIVCSVNGPNKIDRRHRLRGNLLALSDIARGRITPERIETL